MSVESQTLSEELGDKGHWLRKFRKAKNLNTADAAEAATAA